MAGISGLSSGVDYSPLFSSSNQKSSGVDYSSILNLDLADVASVRNGSYGKLLKNYYAKTKEEATAEVGDTDAQLTSIKSDADKLVKAADALNDESLYETKTVTDEYGRSREEFTDSDKLSDTIKDFVTAYNAAIDSAGDSETKSVLRTGSWMAGMTRQNADMLGEVGISIGADDKLSFDEEAFKKANVTTVKDVFTGVNSYGSQVSAKAASISRATQTAGALYTSSGKWSTQANSLAESAIAKYTTKSTDEDEESESAAEDKIVISEEDDGQ